MFRVINKYDKGTVVQISTVFVPVYHVVCWRAFWRWIFQTFIQSTFSKTAISEIHRLWGSSLFLNCSKFNVNFRKKQKNWEKVFTLWVNKIWVGSIKLRLLRRQYLSSAAKVLTKNLKILQRTNVDFFNWIMFRVINKYEKGTVVKIDTVSLPVSHVVCGNAFWRWIFQTFI